MGEDANRAFIPDHQIERLHQRVTAGQVLMLGEDDRMAHLLLGMVDAAIVDIVPAADPTAEVDPIPAAMEPRCDLGLVVTGLDRARLHIRPLARQPLVPPLRVAPDAPACVDDIVEEVMARTAVQDALSLTGHRLCQPDRSRRLAPAGGHLEQQFVGGMVGGNILTHRSSHHFVQVVKVNGRVVVWRRGSFGLEQAAPWPGIRRRFSQRLLCCAMRLRLILLATEGITQDGHLGGNIDHIWCCHVRVSDSGSTLCDALRDGGLHVC